MKILQIIASLDPRLGGPIEGLTQFETALTLAGHTQDIACLDSPNVPWLQNYVSKVIPLGPAVSGYYYTSKLIPWLRSNASCYDCVIVNGLWQFPSFGTWLALKNTKIPFFIYTHGMLDPWFKHTYILKHLKKWLYWPWAEYRVLRDATAVFFTSEEERCLARQSFWLYRCHEAVVGYGTSLPSMDEQHHRDVFLSLFPDLREKRVLLFLSRIHPKKGCDLLLKAFADVATTGDPNIHLVIAGPDQIGWQAELEEEAQELGIQKQVTWTGMLHDSMKWGAFSIAEAFVLPSHQENFGIAITEALACGVPVLISRKVNIWQEIKADGAGFVANDDLKGTIDLLQNWFSLNAEQRALMRQRAQQCFLNRFEINQVAGRLVNALEQYGVGQ